MGELSELTAGLAQGRRGRVIARVAVCHLLANHHHTTVPEIAGRIYPHDKDVATVVPFTRAASTISSMTNTTTLIETVGMGDFISIIAGAAATPSLWPYGTQFRYDGKGAISASALTASANNAAFVGEGLPIPVEQGA